MKRKYGSCARSTVAEALKALEWSGVLSWQNRITRIQLRERDLFGKWSSRWQVIRTSNAYVFRDPGSKSENLPGTPNQNSSLPLLGRPCLREREEGRCEKAAAALTEPMPAASAAALTSPKDDRAGPDMTESTQPAAELEAEAEEQHALE